MPRYQVRVEDANRVLVPFELALDDKDIPLYTSHLLEPVHISVYSQGEEARYANLLPGVGSVYAQDDLSGGLGKKIQVHREDPQFNRYYWAEWFDACARGQAQKGCAVTTLTAPANSGPLSGYFALAGVPFLVLGRRIASWASDALTAVHDYGVSVAGGEAAVFSTDAAAGSVESNTTVTTTSSIASADDRMAQAFRMAGSGIRFLSSVIVQLTRKGLATPGTPVITNMGTAGAVTWTYKVSAVVGVGETPVSAAGSTATGNATLTTTNYNVIAWALVPGATSYKVYRTVAGTTPASTGLIGTSALTYFNDTGLAADGSTPNATDTSGQITGDVRLSLQADLNGNPSGQVITSSSMAAMQVPMAATNMTFRFDDDATNALPFSTPFWLVLDCPGVNPNLTFAWARTNNSTPYARGNGVTSTDRGNTWAVIGTGSQFYFNVFAKTATTTAFIGTTPTGNQFKTTTDGVTFTADTYRVSPHFTVAGGLLVRSLGDGNTASATGAIEWSKDGANWNQDVIVIGDPAVPITNLLTLGEVVIICKEDSVFALDIQATPIDVQALYSGGRATTNGQGACVWKGAAYIPFNGRLMAITGDTVPGFVVYESVGIEALQEWDWPWGQGRHVACVGTRFHLYSLVSATGGYRLLKSSNPLRKKADGVPDPEWHGSLATIGDGTQSVTMMAHFDPGGAGSPQLFMTTTSNNVIRVQLPRSFNPASDTTYPFDISTPADLYLPVANGNYPVHPKAWLTESVTFQLATAGDYVEPLWDTLDGESWRRMPKGGRLYNTDALPYPRGLSSRLLQRRIRMVNTLTTASPQLHALAVSYAMRHIPGAAMREIKFTVVVEDGLSAADLGEMLNIGAQSERNLLALAAGGGSGTRRMEDPYGRTYQQVQFLDAAETIQVPGQTSGGRSRVEITAVAVGG